ncbi:MULTISPECIES: hypothetical protein [Serratia]|uniref:hypothetical protein n=1 Tax=Serratia TaxID=613 RepID=UPI001EF66915|nr:MULTISPECIES: hypothetical protein [Serratia]
MKIESCRNNWWGSCNITVMYSGTSEMREIGIPTTRPDDFGGTGLFYNAFGPAGVYCQSGMKRGEFKGCSFSIGDPRYSPRPIKCKLIDGTSWRLKDDTCDIGPTWGPGVGAGPGHQCVIFGIQLIGYSLLTPWGVVDADTAANSGNQWCLKPTAPDVICSVYLPPLIDHGQLVAGSSDKKYIDGAVDCGISPVVEIVGSTSLNLGSGVQSKLTTTLLSNTSVRVESDLTVAKSAPPGEYFASVVVVVSPN